MRLYKPIALLGLGFAQTMSDLLSVSPNWKFQKDHKRRVVGILKLMLQKIHIAGQNWMN